MPRLSKYLSIVNLTISTPPLIFILSDIYLIDNFSVLVYTYIGIYKRRILFMKLLIVGSRSITDFDLSPYISKDVDTIISGGANGIDTLAEKYADENRLSKFIVRPRYDLYGRAAPLRRNEQMVDLADAVLVIWDGQSKGTQYTLKHTKKKNKPITLVQI